MKSLEPLAVGWAGKSSWGRLGRILLVVLLALAVVPRAAAQLQNPGFEADAPGSTTVTDWWSVNGGTPEVSSSVMRSGSQSASLSFPGNGSYYELRSSTGVSLRGGHYVHVVGNFKGTGQNAAVGVAINSGTTRGTPIALSTTWKTSTHYVQGSLGDTAYARLVANAASGQGIVYWDDIVLYTNSSQNFDTTAPADPGSVGVSGPTLSSLTVSWGPSLGDATGSSASGLLGYLVIRGTVDPATAPVAGVCYKPGYNATLGSGVAVYRGSGTSFTDTGLLPGTKYYYRVYALDQALNYSASVAVSGTTEACAPPAGPVTVTPASALVNEGGEVTFVSSLTGSGLGYQWSKAGGDISGATASSYTLSGVTHGAAGSYEVRVTNNCGSVTSSPAMLVVNRIPVGTADELSTWTNLAASVSAAKLLANDTDADGDTLSITSVGTPSPEGSTVVLSGGVVTYQPAAGFAGQGSFSYMVSDGRGGTASVLVTVTMRSGGTGGLSANVVGDPWIDETKHEFVVRFAGIPGQTYTVEWSDTANGPWHKLENHAVSATDIGFGVGVFEVRQATGGATSRFYRTVWPGY